MKRSLWLLMLFLLAGHVPAASADSACEGRFCKPDHGYLLELYFPALAGQYQSQSG